MLKVTEFPQSLVEEGTTERFTCLSDEGNPPPIIRWDLGDGYNKVKSGRFHASITENILDITVDSTMRKGEIICFIEADPTKGQNRLEQRIVLSVRCE